MGGREMWAKMWVNRGQDGSEYFTVSLRPKDEVGQQTARLQQPAPSSPQRQGTYKAFGQNVRPQVRPPEPPCDVGDGYEPQGDNWEREF